MSRDEFDTDTGFKESKMLKTSFEQRDVLIGRSLCKCLFSEFNWKIYVQLCNK